MKLLGQKMITIHSSQKPEMENTFKLETSQSPKYSERKYCLLPFSFAEYVVLVPNGDDDDYDDDDD